MGRGPIRRQSAGVQAPDLLKMRFDEVSAIYARSSRLVLCGQALKGKALRDFLTVVSGVGPGRDQMRSCDSLWSVSHPDCGNKWRRLRHVPVFLSAWQMGIQ